MARCKGTDVHRNELRDAQEFIAVSLKIGLKEWALLIAAACVAASLFYTAREVLFNGGAPSSFSVSLGVIASILFALGTDTRANRTHAKWLLVATIAVSLLLGTLVALPTGNPVVRLLLVAAAVLFLVGSILKLRRL